LLCPFRGPSAKQWLTGTALAVLALLAPVAGKAPDTRLEDAHLAWDQGDYPGALTAYLALLTASDDPELFEQIALQTGELLQTTELTPNGGAPQFSPDGRHLTYEIGRGVGRRTRVALTTAPAAPLHELTGHGASFSPGGAHLAYFQLTATPALTDLEAAADRAVGQERAEAQAALAQAAEAAARITIRDLASGGERSLALDGWRKSRLLAGTADTLLFAGAAPGATAQIYLVPDGGVPSPITSGEEPLTLLTVNATGTAALFIERGPPDRSRPPRFGVIALPGGTVTRIEGSSPAFSPAGESLAYVRHEPGRSQLLVASTATPAAAAVVRTGAEPIAAPALSADGGRLAFQMMPGHDWEIFTINRDGSGEERVTREIQHDVAPQFLTGTRLLGTVGEPRHRRSYLYELPSNRKMRLFHNNTVRTIAPEYAWVASRDGTKLLIVAERDGDTVSPDRGVYLTDLAKPITRAELRARLERSLAAETALREKGLRTFAPIAARVRDVVGQAAVARIFGYEQALFDFDSKHMSQPGNAQASAWLFETYASFGYRPEYQWLTGRGALGGRTANVVATLPGTDNPELVYVVSSHYDSVADGPGADDDSSGTAALLEVARILARHPQPATIVFASFTGEESGLLGSREFVRRAVGGGMQIAGALNNDMIGWANDHRLDNTIRYSNEGIRDVQHAAAIQFSQLITYDARYYRNTDAHAYYEAYGDIVGGIGSYPVLGSPHYHEPHDVLETINHPLVTEVAKTTAATLMLLASSPSPIKDLRVAAYRDGRADLSWTPSPEKGVTGYLVRWEQAGQPAARQIRVTKPAAAVTAAPGTVIAVKAVNQQGLEGWDWARTTILPDAR
jgi:hypothetical protein